MPNPIDEFVTKEDSGKYKFKIGTVVASSLSGFIAGALLTGIAWLLFIIAGL